MTRQKSNILTDIPGIRARTLPILMREGRWRLEELRGRPESTFLWVTRGQGRLMVGPVTRGFGPNTILYVPARAFHAVHLASAAQGFAIHAAETLPIPVPDAPAVIRAVTITEQGQLTSYTEQIQTEAAARAPGAEQAAESLLALLSVWIERNRDRNDWQPAPRTKGAILLERFLRLLEADFAAGRNLGQFADLLDVTPTHLTRLCKAGFGKGAHDLIRDRLLLEARLLLRDTDLKVVEISQRLGFSSAAYFSRLFLARTGQTPVGFRVAPTNEGGRGLR